IGREVTGGALFWRAFPDGEINARGRGAQRRFGAVSGGGRGFGIPRRHDDQFAHGNLQNATAGNQVPAVRLASDSRERLEASTRIWEVRADGGWRRVEIARKFL